MNPLVADWFLSRFSAPTPVQEGVWEALAAGEHILAEAPTGSGKTLAAFLLALSRFVDGSYEAEGLSVLYISPLKALNEDIRRNLLEPIEGILALARSRAVDLPAIRVETRSGDTTDSARRRFLTRPPSILCTTPESLAILLDSPRARPVLSSIRLLIVDEIHAVTGNKRGAHLASSIGRLALLAGEFQRVALSATLKPAALVAEWFGAWRLEGEPGKGARRVQRKVRIVSPRIGKAIEFRVTWPAAGDDLGRRESAETRPEGGASRSASEASRSALEARTMDSRYAVLVPALLERMGRARTTMIFCDARRRAERLAFLLNEEAARRGAEDAVAWAHHGSLSREIREAVESRLKAGELPAVVATGSLELGIDIGSVDRVILAGAPPSIAQALQRGGRSGHGVGRLSRVEIMPFHGLELIAAAAIVREAESGRIEESRPPRNPLDILAQVLLSLAAEESRSPDALFDIVTSFSPFAELPRNLFDATLDMLRGRWSPPEGGSAPRELGARVFVDPATGLVVASRGVRALLWTGGGTIPDRGLYSLRVAGEGRRIGELDEEFVFERKTGDAFTLGSQSWRIVEIGAEAVSVVPLDRPADFIPFWKGGPLHASPELAKGTLELVDRLAGAGKAERRAILAEECRFDDSALDALCDFLEAQIEAQQGLPLPGKRTLVLEGLGGRRSQASSAVLIHDFRGGLINEGLAFLVERALSEKEGIEVQVHADNEGVLVVAPAGGGDGALIRMLERILRSYGDSEAILSTLRAGLEASGLFATAFRENAGRALLLPRGFAKHRQPLWLSRLRSARLFAAVRDKRDFPITIETWRSLLSESIDLEGLSDLMKGLASGAISLGSFASDRPSPFASGAAWMADADFMYRPDELHGGMATVTDEAIALALDSPLHRPLLDPRLVEDFARKRKRLLRGWAPESLIELAAWIDERVAMPLAELRELLALGGLVEDFDADPTGGGRFDELVLPGAKETLVVTASRREELVAGAGDCLAEWLRFEGPVDAAVLEGVFGTSIGDFSVAAEALLAEGSVVRGALVRGGGDSIVDRDNYEILLGMSRAAARPRVSARPPADLFRLVAALHGLPRRAGREAPPDPARILRRLAGYPAALSAWRDRILSARLGPDWLAIVDRLISEEGWLWFGTGREALAFADAWNYDLFARPGLGSTLLEPGELPLDFWAIRERRGGDSKSLALALWAEAWEGRLASDSLSSVLEAAANGFGRKLPTERGEEDRSEFVGKRPDGGGRRTLPASFRHRWRRGAPVAGRWSAMGLEVAEGEVDALEDEEMDRERVRILVSRYGVLLRPLLERELEGLSWSRLFRCMRNMELAGELVSGDFFEGLASPQFMGPEALALFSRLDSLEDEGPLWLSALDPASPAGFPFVDAQGLSVPRGASTALCLWKGRSLALSRRSGKALEFDRDLDPAARLATVEAWAEIVGRVRLETVDGEAAAESPIAEILLARGFEADRGSLRRWG